MKIFTAILLFASAVAAQEIAGSGGEVIADGPAAVSDTNINSGTQSTNSLFDNSSKGGNTLDHLNNNSFKESTSNTGVSNNNIVNPSSSGVSGNTGNTANGHGNKVGKRLH
ncbi:hypothetical protein H4R18_003362 [Coemansia javaensis]|uniref:Uncharacterized protein n=1 Tax=Coemansia javaensis TaxID=2761396 RepID=A0A9W8H776_9FUNG|nr:hypothetical protein H4R18_003362 [Coemansia javaensis]